MSSDPRDVLAAWVTERQGMAMNTVLYSQPLSLTEEQVRALLDLRICRAAFTTENAQVVHCVLQENHDTIMHRAGFSWPACVSYATRHGDLYPCIRPGQHRGKHDFGGRGPDYKGWTQIVHPEGGVR